MGSVREVEPGGLQGGVDRRPRRGGAFGAGPQQGARRTAEPAPQQGPFPKVLGHGEGRVQVADPGDRAEGTEPAYGGEPSGQALTADLGMALRWSASGR